MIRNRLIIINYQWIRRMIIAHVRETGKIVGRKKMLIIFTSDFKMISCTFRFVTTFQNEGLPVSAGRFHYMVYCHFF